MWRTDKLRNRLKPIFIVFIDQSNTPNCSDSMHSEDDSSSCCSGDREKFGHKPLRRKARWNSITNNVVQSEKKKKKRRMTNNDLLYNFVSVNDTSIWSFFSLFVQNRKSKWKNVELTFTRVTNDWSLGRWRDRLRVLPVLLRSAEYSCTTYFLRVICSRCFNQWIDFLLVETVRWEWRFPFYFYSTEHLQIAQCCSNIECQWIYSFSRFLLLLLLLLFLCPFDAFPSDRVKNK